MDARIDTLYVDARVIAWTVAVAVAADHAAAIQGITMIALTAAAVGYVIVREALGVGTAQICDQAWIHTVIILAGLIEHALTVVLALDGMTGDLGIALIALLARADWFMILYVASGVSTAVARVATLPVNTRLTITAIVIRRTRSNDRQLYYNIEIINGLPIIIFKHYIVF